MSDYGDDYSDYDDDWMYVEDEYMAADDLAEHAVASPPPTTYGDDDMIAEWDRFDYFNDLEYASDGYDDAKFQPHDVKDAKIPPKRKRTVTSSHGKKKRRAVGDALGSVQSGVAAHSPIVWRSQKDREQTQRLLEPKASYALLSDWRDKLADTPRWARASPPPESPSARPSKSAAVGAYLLDDAGWEDDEEMEDDGEGAGDGGLDISQDALMAALQKQLAAAGGPLSGMDPQQLLFFAMRMATDKDAGDDIAGEMAEAMLGGDEEEEEGDEDAEENLLSWVAKQRNANKDASAPEPKSPEAARDNTRPPTPPSSEANRSVKAVESGTKTSEAKSKTWSAKETRPATSLKRKAGEDAEAESSNKTTKKRATRSFDAPTTASQARTTSSKTRLTRSKR